jgi:WD40 repeat protein
MLSLPPPARPAFPVLSLARLLGLLLFCASVLLLTLPAPAQSEPDVKQIGKLIEQLGDDELDTRKAAEKKLADIGEAALPQLRKAAKEHLDADVRLRAIVLLRVIEKGAFGEIRKFVGHTGNIRHIAVSRDGKRALTAGMDNTARLWEIDTGKELKKLTGHTGWVWSVAFSPDEKQALTSGSLDRTMRRWDLQDGKEVRKYEGHTGRVYGAAFSPDGKYVLSGGTEKIGAEEKNSTLRLYEIDTAKEVRKFEGHTGWVWKVAFSPDGKKIASAGCNDYSFRIWDTETGKPLIVGANAHKGYVVGIAFSPDGKQLLTSGRDQSVKLWDVETGKLIKTYTGTTNNVEAVAFSSDGKRFLAGENKLVHLFDTESGKILHRFEDHTGWVYAVAFVDARRALSAGEDNTLRLWGLPK